MAAIYVVGNIQFLSIIQGGEVIMCTLKKVLLLLMLLSSMSAVMAWEAAPEALLYPESISKSQGLWNRDEKVKDHASSYFRYHINVPGKIKKAVFRANFDDSGAAWVNGKSVDPNVIAANIVSGKNLLAFKVTNKYGSARLLFYGEITLESGEKIYLHSTKDVKAAAQVTENWFSLQFDDSKWQPALELGDVRSRPWSRYYNYIPLYTSPEEKAMLDKIKEKAIFVPESSFNIPTPDAKIIYQGHLPKISLNGKLLDPIFNTNVSPMTIYSDSYMLRYAREGVNIHTILIHDEFFYKGNGKIDFSYADLDLNVRRVLHLDPNAKFRIYIRLGSSNTWYKENPSELIQYVSGPIDSEKNEITERVPRPSPASEKFCEFGKNSIRKLAEYINSMPWANRVIMTQVGFGIYGEWHLYGMYQGADSSPMMLAEFQKSIREKYRNVEDLQKAWQDSSVNFENITAPTMAERAPDALQLDPKTQQKTIDYFECQANVVANLLLELSKECKKSFPGRLCGAYYGYVLTIHPPEGSNVMLDKVMSSPSIDYLCIPPNYYPECRIAGRSYMSRGITSTFHRYGKLAIVEDDMRFHHLKDVISSGEWRVAAKNALESQMIMRRNYCNMLMDGAGIQLTDAGEADQRPNNFDHPSVIKGFHESQQVAQKIPFIPAESGNKCAVVFDYRERLRSVGKSLTAGNIKNQVYSLALMRLFCSGAAFDLVTLQDFLASDKEYTTVVFLNLFSLSDAERRAVKAKVRNKGVSAVYMLAPGYVTSKGFSNSAMSDFCGIKLTGASAIPDVKCIDPAAKKYKNGIAVKMLADGSKSIFVPQFPENEKMWQDILKMAGAWVYTDSGNYFRRHGDIFLFHTGKKGTFKINLPEKSGEVIELFSGKRCNVSDVRVNSKGAGTWLFRLVK